MVTLRNGRFGEYVQLGEGEKPKRGSLPKGLAADDVTLEKALACCRCRARWRAIPPPASRSWPASAAMGSYVQHGKAYASLGKDDDVLEIGANRAIDLIVAKESGASSRFGSGRRAACSATIPRAARCRSRPGGLVLMSTTARSTPRLPKGTNPDELTLGAGAGGAEGQSGRRRARRPAARRASRGRRDQRAGGPFRALCEMGQGQRDDAEVDRRRTRSRSGRGGIDRRARGQAGETHARSRPPRRRRPRPSRGEARKSPAKPRKPARRAAARAEARRAQVACAPKTRFAALRFASKGMRHEDVVLVGIGLGRRARERRQRKDAGLLLRGLARRTSSRRSTPPAPASMRRGRSTTG